MTKMILTAVLATLLNTACSVKTEDRTPALRPDPEFKHQVEGFAVEGSWSSGCNPEFNRYRQKKMSFSGQNFQRSDNLYFDYKCTQIDFKDESKGLFRWLSQTGYGGFLAEYKIDFKGLSYYMNEEILLENGKLYIGGIDNTDDPNIEKLYPMKKD